MNWNHRDAAAAFSLLVDAYGQPSSIDNSPGGTIIWKRDRLLDTCFDRIEVRDESIPHCHPMSHQDFVYTSVKYDVPPSKFLDVTSLTGGITYDPLKKELRSRCGSASANIAILALATHIGEGNLSLNYVQANNMLGAWIYDIQNPEKLEQMYDLLCYNLKHQRGNPVPEGFWVLANPEGCP